MKHGKHNLICLLLVAGVAIAQDRPRVFLQAVSQGNTWSARRDQSIEMAKDFEKHCPDAGLTIAQEKADYTVILSHIEVGWFARDNQIEVANKDGDVLSASDKSAIKGGVKDVCQLILADWRRRTDPKPPAPTVMPQVAVPDNSVEARKRFAETADRKLRAESSGFAEMVNTTLVIHNIYADKDRYEALIGDHKFATDLRQRGFTQFVYTDDGRKTFTWEIEPRADAKSSYSY
jgi:hypothetical protein